MPAIPGLIVRQIHEIPAAHVAGPVTATCRNCAHALVALPRPVRLLLSDGPFLMAWGHHADACVRCGDEDVTIPATPRCDRPVPIGCAASGCELPAAPWSPWCPACA